MAQIFKTRSKSRDTLFEEVNTELRKVSLFFILQNVRSILQDLQMLLASVKENKNVSLEFPIVGFLNDKSFKEHLVREALPTIDNVGGFELCGKGTCQMCGYIIRNNNFFFFLYIYNLHMNVKNHNHQILYLQYLGVTQKVK